MKILIAVDGSESSEAMIQEIMRRSWPSDYKLRVVTVIEVPIIYGTVMTVDHLPKTILEIAERITTKAVETLKQAGWNVSYKVRQGVADEEIIEEARSWDADLIMVGSNGRRGLSKFLLGSVAQRVSTRACCSVEIVRKKATSIDSK